jgi:hypothetical protein
MTAFCGLGEWKGTAEVYDGQGRFLGNGVDQRHARSELDDGRIRIDLSFVGPFKFTGHYVIHDRGTHRVYQGPVNLGLAEAIGEDLVDAENYWPDVGLSQRFFLMVLPGGEKQLSLALLSRGEHLQYVVVGENDRVVACGVDGQPAVARPPSFIAGASCDLGRDPAAGRGELLLHRPGRWSGTLTSVDGQLNQLKKSGEVNVLETVAPDGAGALKVRLAGGAVAPEPTELSLKTDGTAAWTAARGPLVGSYSLAGGRALSGVFHRVGDELRVWRREVVSHDGLMKGVVHTIYRGGQRIGVQHGVLHFEPASGKGA